MSLRPLHLMLLLVAAFVLQGMIAQPVSARQCLRVDGVSHCTEPAMPSGAVADLGQTAFTGTEVELVPTSLRVTQGLCRTDVTLPAPQEHVALRDRPPKA